jgi:HK97 family phage major capsid protein
LAELAELHAKIDGLMALELLSDEQVTEHENLLAECDNKKKAIQKEKDRLAREEERAALEAEAQAVEAARAARLARDKQRQERRQPAQPQGPLADRQPPTPADVPAARPITVARDTIPATVIRSGSLKHFVGTRDGREAAHRAYRFGMFNLALMAMQLPGRFGMLPKFREAVEFFNREWLPNIGAVHNSNDATGAQFLIPPEFSMDMIDLRERYGVARRLLRTEVMTSDTKTVPRRSGGLTAYFVSEGSAGTESNKSWSQVGLTAKDVMAISRYSGQVNADAAINFGDDLAGEIAYAFSNLEDSCAFNGDGTSTYGGIVGIRVKLTGTGTAGVATQGSSNTWSAIVLGDFDAVVGKLPQYADTPNAAWLMHRTFYYTVVEKLVQASGGVPAYEVRQGQRGRPIFKGYPVEFSQVFPSTTATATLVCTLGDYSLGAAFGDRQQESIMFSEHASVGGQSVFERNQIAIRGTERFDINVHDAGDSSAPGPIVGLKTGP